MIMHIDYERDLNPSQLSAVINPEGPLLVIAGAGSGKTRTIVYRVAWLVEHGIDPGSILLLTFTRKAAEEMLSRATELLDQRVSRVAGGTFHSTAYLLLRRYGLLIGLKPGFSIMDQGDSIEAVDHVRAALNLTKQEAKLFPKARTLLEIMGKTVNTGNILEEVLKTRYPHFIEYLEQIDLIHVRYQDHKNAAGLLDYDDLLTKTIRLLEEHENVRDEISRRWNYILVDEYQDTNILQARMVRLFASAHENVTVVGDDSQSIYSFRGADFRNIMEFPKLFPGARMIMLEENYRSTAPILRVTNGIIEQAELGYPKRLFTKKEGGPLPMAASVFSERDQSEFAVRCINELIHHGIKLSEIAVLFRAGFHSFDLETLLSANRIPYVKYGGFKFLEGQHIKDVLAHLRVANNLLDRLSWVRILKLLPGIGPKTALKMADRFAKEGISISPEKARTQFKKMAEPMISLLNLLIEVRDSSNPLSRKIETINQYYFPHLKETYDNYPKRMRDLEQLADMAASYTALDRFVSEIALEPPDDDRYGEDKDALVLSTIHSSKGLEWHTVILLWAVEGRLPSPRSNSSMDELEEERRLLYVATTRARHNLVIISPKYIMDRKLGMISVRMSRFFEALPKEFFREFRGK